MMNRGICIHGDTWSALLVEEMVEIIMPVMEEKAAIGVEQPKALSQPCPHCASWAPGRPILLPDRRPPLRTATGGRARSEPWSSGSGRCTCLPPHSVRPQAWVLRHGQLPMCFQQTSTPSGFPLRPLGTTLTFSSSFLLKKQVQPLWGF